MIRVPATGDPFLWRVSIAQIDASGPFSNFTGYSRKMVLLRGAGLRLKFAAGPDRHLHDIGDADLVVAEDLAGSPELAQEMHVHGLGSFPSTAVTEDVDALLAVRALQVAHVFHQSENRHSHLLEHVDGFAGIFERNFGRCGDDYRSGERCGLDQRELNVARARGKIDDQIVELAPINVAEELLDRAVQHGSAPHQRLVAGIHETHRHQFHAVFLDRLDTILIRAQRLIHAHHERNVRAIHVCVKEPDAAAEICQRDRQIDRDRGLADAALPRADCDQVLNAGNRKFRRRLWRLRTHEV